VDAMRKAQAKFVTAMARTSASGSVSRSGYRQGRAAQETWVFIWNELDELLQHLQRLTQDPENGFDLADLLWVMAAARWQARPAPLFLAAQILRHNVSTHAEHPGHRVAGG
jgi:hypothetical protein